jgi:Family of unknown function (DUF5677)
MIDAPDITGIEPLLDFLREMISSWDSRRGEPSSVGIERGADNTRLIYGFTAHTVDLARAVVALHEAKLGSTALRLIRGAMECAITAAWLAHRPEQTTRLLYSNMLDARTIFQEAKQFGRGHGFNIKQLLKDTEEDIAEMERATPPPAPLSIFDRYYGLEGGPEYYVEYRQTSMWCHPTGALAGEYIQMVPPTEAGIGGLVIAPREGRDETAESYLGQMACMVVIAQVAYESTQVSPTRMHYLKTQAERVGIAGPIAKRETKHDRDAATQPPTLKSPSNG